MSDDDKPSLSTDPTVPPAANSDQAGVNIEARGRSFANTVKADMQKFEEVNRQSQMRKNIQRQRYVVVTHQHRLHFLVYLSKSLFVSVG